MHLPSFTGTKRALFLPIPTCRRGHYSLPYMLALRGGGQEANFAPVHVFIQPSPAGDALRGPMRGFGSKE